MRPEFPALWAAGNTNYWTGPVGLKSAARVGVATNSLLYLSGQIAGAGDLTFEGPGKVILSGAAPNTYTGTTWFKGGDAECRKTATHGAIPGPLVVGDPDTNAHVYVELTLTNLPQMHALAPVVLHKLGLLRPKGNGEETLGSLAGEGRGFLEHGGGGLPARDCADVEPFGLRALDGVSHGGRWSIRRHKHGLRHESILPPAPAIAASPE